MSLIFEPFAPPPQTPALCLEINRSVSILSCKAAETSQKLPLFFAPARETRTSGLLNPDRVVEISEEETIDSCFAFVRDYHLLVGGSTGTVLAAIQRLAPEFSFGETTVAISPDLGER
jgi:cysteine synthase